MPLKKGKSSARRSAESIDRLIRVSHREYVAFTPRQLLQNSDLREICILKFIDQNETRALTFPSQQFGVACEQCMSTRDHVAERTQVLVAEHRFDRCEDIVDLAAALDYLCIPETLRILRFTNPRDR